MRNSIFFVEFLLFDAAVLGWAWWQLRGLRKDREASAKEKESKEK